MLTDLDDTDRCAHPVTRARDFANGTVILRVQGTNNRICRDSK
jgi:hypothetical protein